MYSLEFAMTPVHTFGGLVHRDECISNNDGCFVAWAVVLIGNNIGNWFWDAGLFEFNRGRCIGCWITIIVST